MLYIDDNIYSFDIDEAMTMLPDQRRERVSAYRNERDRRASIAAYLLLRRALRENYDIDELVEFGYEEGGKPFIIGHGDIHFNISHCRVAVACVVSDRPVGVDIESIRPFKAALAKHVLNDDEYATVISSDRPDAAFVRLWTMKEAYVKMTGNGLRSGLRELDISEVRFETIERDTYICTWTDGC